MPFRRSVQNAVGVEEVLPAHPVILVREDQPGFLVRAEIAVVVEGDPVDGAGMGEEPVSHLMASKPRVASNDGTPIVMEFASPSERPEMGGHTLFGEMPPPCR